MVRPGGGSGHSGSFGSFVCAQGVFGFIRVRPGGRCVHSGSFGSFVCALVVVGFIRARLVHSGAPWVLLGSFEFDLAAPWGVIRVRLVLSGASCWSFGEFGCAMRVVVFVRVRWVHSCVPWWSLVGSFMCALGVVGCIRLSIRVRPGCLWVHSGSFGAIQCAEGVIRVRLRAP